MGVTGLWKLIEPCGKPVPVDTLEGKIIAIDISIWLHQVVKGFQDSKGSALANAHLLGLFHRLCKLLYYRVRPVFVFDGCTPQLKRDTIARRRQQRSKLNTEADRIQALLLESLAKEKVVQQALGATAAELLKSPLKRTKKTTRAENAMDELFKLPDLPASANATNEDTQDDESDCKDTSTDISTDDSSFDESNPRHYYNSNLQAIDVQSQHFRNLPADVRHEILVDIKETRKQSSWGRLHELPSRSDDFSTFQMKRLLKRRAVQESLEEAEQEMGGHTLTYNELKNLFTEEGIVEPSSIEKTVQRISSDENTRYLLVRDLKKKLTKVEEESDTKPPLVKKEDLDDTPSTSAQATKQNSSNSLGDEYDADLELAIALSLENTTQVYSEKDYEYDEEMELKLNREQRKQLQNAAVGPARAYMIEYAGMNEDEVVGILEKTQVSEPCNAEPSIIQELFQESVGQDEEKDKTESNQKEAIKSSTEEPKPTSIDSDDESNMVLRVSDTETDSDLEEVTELETKATPVPIPAKSLQIVLDIKEPLAPKDDLFADIFESDKPESNEKAAVSITNAATDETAESKTKNVSKVEEVKALNDDEILLNAVKKIEESELFAKLSTPEKGKNSAEITQAALVNKSTQMLSILDELKQQAEDVKKINLSDVHISSSVIEISDDELSQQLHVTAIKSDVIEICDSDDNIQRNLNTVNKSPKQKTPSKNKSITEFFDTNFVIKRTPEKTADEEHVPKVKSPFFVNKTPQSNRKRQAANDGTHSPATTQKISKAAKTLFGNEIEPESEGVKPLEETPPSAEDVLKSAADALKEQNTEEELQAIATDLAKERRELESERNRQDRMGMSISHRMNADCQQLLRLFGVPYIIAPMEAEAQCAFLDDVELTNGTITDDSDIWLFGGRTVYKNFFAQDKHVLEFRAERIEDSFNCDRKKLIQLACLVGSDYTTGVHGIGAVTALEILASFSPPKDAQKTDDANMAQTISAALATLSKFRDWWQAHKCSTAPIGSSARLALSKKLKNIELHEGFPSAAVIEAYLTPQVDDSKDAFTWGHPDVESIREFAKKSFGWTTLKTDELLQPVLKRINEKKSQSSIRNYFTVKSALKVSEIKVSKRVQKAIDKMSGKPEAQTPDKPAKATRAKRTKRKAASTEANEQDDAVALENTTSASEAVATSTLEPSTSKTAPPKRPTRTPRIPNPKQVIPQRERDLEQMRKNKEKAALLMKNSAPTVAKEKR